MEWPAARIAIFACCYAIQTMRHVVFGRNIATEFKYSRAIILGIFESKRRGGEKREWNNDEPGLIGALLCLDTSMNPVKSSLPIKRRQIEDEQNIRSNVSNTDFWNSISIRVFDTRIYIYSYRSSIIHPSFYLLWAYLHVTNYTPDSSEISFRYKYRSKRLPTRWKTTVKNFLSEISIPNNRYHVSFSLSGSD